MSRTVKQPEQLNVPAYRRHKPSGQAAVRLNGKDFYLGPYNTEESRSLYDRLTAEWKLAGRTLAAAVAAYQRFNTPTDRLEIAEIVNRYREYADRYYRKNGQKTTEPSCIRSACRPLLKLYARTPAEDFGPLALKTVRQEMIGLGWCRKHVNGQVSRIKQMFRWAVENELLPVAVYQALATIKDLAKGRTDEHGAPESDPVRPVAETHIQAVESHVSRQVWAMIQVQKLTGMRPGEVVLIRRCDLDTSGKVWMYRPHRHKTEHHGKEKVVAIGPTAQEHIRPFFKPELDAYLFSPADAQRDRLEERRKNRTTPLHRGNRPGTNKRRHPRRRAGERYTVDSYRRAIARACILAFPAPAELTSGPEQETDEAKTARLARLARWRRAHDWHPHQLRHNAATRIRKEYGLDAARAVLGEASTTTAGIYADLDQGKAAEVMLKIG